MDLLIELILELVIGGSIEGAASNNVPKGIRIIFMIFVSMIFGIFIYTLAWLFFVANNILVKILLAGVVLLLVVGLIYLWYGIRKRRIK